MGARDEISPDPLRILIARHACTGLNVEVSLMADVRYSPSSTAMVFVRKPKAMAI